MDAHVGVRLHSCILATGAGVPSLGVQYMTKHREYFEMLGIDDYLLSEDDVTAEALDLIVRPALGESAQQSQNTWRRGAGRWWLSYETRSNPCLIPSVSEEDGAV